MFKELIKLMETGRKGYLEYGKNTLEFTSLDRIFFNN